MYWVSNLVYFPGLLYFAVSNALVLAGPRGAAHADDPTLFIVASLAGLAIALGLNLVGLGVGKWLHNVGAVATWTSVAILIGVAGFAWSRVGSATSFNVETLAPATGLKDIVLWSTIAFAFSGLEAASMLGGEIASARRTVPRAIVIAGAAIVSTYVLGTVAVLVALPPAEVSTLHGFLQAIGKAGAGVGLPAAGVVAALFLTVGNIGGVGAWLTASARLPFVAGLDRYLPPAFGRLHPRWGTPWVALLVQAVGTAWFIVLGQAGDTVKAAYNLLVGMAVITYFLPYLLMFAALIRLQRELAGPDVRRVPGGAPVAVAMAMVGFATTAVAIVLACLPPADSRDPALAVLKIVGSNLALVALGIWLYRRGRARRAAGG
jgi:amino acid transporter